MHHSVYVDEPNQISHLPVSCRSAMHFQSNCCMCGLLEWCFTGAWRCCRGSNKWFDRLWRSDTWCCQEWDVFIVCCKCRPTTSHYRQWQRPVFTRSHNSRTTAEHNCTKRYRYCTKCNHYCTTSDMSFCPVFTYCWRNFPTIIIGIVIKDVSISHSRYGIYLSSVWLDLCLEKPNLT